MFFFVCLQRSPAGSFRKGTKRNHLIVKPHSNMKQKTLLIALIVSLLSVSTLQAQRTAGRREVTGTFSLSAVAAYGGFGLFNVLVNPSIGWFVKDNLSVGATLHYEGTGELGGLGLGPQVTYYFPSKSIVNFFLDAFGGLQMINFGGYNFVGGAVGVGAGVSCDITPRVAWRSGIDYKMGIYSSSNLVHRIGLDMGFSVNF